jgi:hypothetical protein
MSRIRTGVGPEPESTSAERNTRERFSSRLEIGSAFIWLSSLGSAHGYYRAGR